MPPGGYCKTQLVLQLDDETERRVDIVESWSETALSAINLPLLTTSCNVITAETICIPFPNLTINKEFAKARMEILTEEERVSLDMANLTEVKLGRRRTRWFWDLDCLVIRLGPGTKRGGDDEVEDDEVNIEMH